MATSASFDHEDLAEVDNGMGEDPVSSTRKQFESYSYFSYL